jgi:hypothetical protein
MKNGAASSRLSFQAEVETAGDATALRAIDLKNVSLGFEDSVAIAGN